MLLYDFYLFKRSGELLLNISNHNLKTKPVLIANFLSALNAFSHEVTKSGIDVIVLGDKVFLMAETDGLLLAMYVYESENLTSIRSKLNEMVDYIKQTENDLDQQLVYKDSISDIKKGIMSIINSTSMWFSESDTEKIITALEDILVGTNIDGYLLMSQDGLIIMSENIDEEDKIRIMRHIETLGEADKKDALSDIIFVYENGKQIYVKFLKHFAMALRIKSNIYLGLISEKTVNSLHQIFEQIDVTLSELFFSHS